MLCETARRLVAIVRGADVVARLGGDEFVVVYEPKDPSSDRLVDRIDAALAEPIDIADKTSVRCPASVGTADTRDGRKERNAAARRGRRRDVPGQASSPSTAARASGRAVKADVPGAKTAANRL